MSDINTTHNRFVWMDIPVADLDRAIAFYTAVAGVPVHREKMEHFEFAVIEHDQGNGGCLVPNPDKISAEHGPLVYLNVEGRLRDAVTQVTAHGGTVTEDVHSIGPYGFRALIVDSEGNRLALHAKTDS